MVNLVLCVFYQNCKKKKKKRRWGQGRGERKKKHAMQRPSEKLERDQTHSSELPGLLGQRSLSTGLRSWALSLHPEDKALGGSATCTPFPIHRLGALL